MTPCPHLACIIHERFHCNRGFAATTGLDAAGSPLGRSTSCSRSLPSSRLRTPVSLGDCAISLRTVMNNAG
jgi:hypothetical protein